MNTSRTALLVALVATGVAVGYLSGQGRVTAAPAGLTAQDYADIQQLYWRYNHGADFSDGELFASAFADDGVFSTGLGPDTVGRDAITAAMSRDEKGADTGKRHWNNGWRITPSPEGARGRVYWMVLDVASGDPVGDLPGVVGWTPRSTGVYEDVYVKTSEGWRMKSRTLHWDTAEE